MYVQLMVSNNEMFLHTIGQRAESALSNRINDDKRRTFGNFKKDYADYLIQLLQMLHVPCGLSEIVILLISELFIFSGLMLELT